MSRVLLFSVIASLVFGVHGRETRAQSITDIVVASGGEFDQNPFDYDILLSAVLTAGLDGALADPNLNSTVFAPNDLGFIRTARDLGYSGFSEQGAWDFLVTALTDLGDGDPIPTLTAILTYHVAPGKRGLFNVIFSRSIPTLQGGVIRPRFFRLRDNEPDVRDPRLFLPFNIRADNGIIHTVQRVLLPVDLP